MYSCLPALKKYFMISKMHSLFHTHYVHFMTFWDVKMENHSFSTRVRKQHMLALLWNLPSLPLLNPFSADVQEIVCSNPCPRLISRSYWGGVGEVHLTYVLYMAFLEIQFVSALLTSSALCLPSYFAARTCWTASLCWSHSDSCLAQGKGLPPRGDLVPCDLLVVGSLWQPSLVPTTDAGDRVPTAVVPAQ
jgi:hypothetical protein